MNHTAIKIKKIREYNNFSQNYMAEQLNISQSAYAKIESGSIALTEDKLRKIAQILKVDMDKLLSSEDLVFNIHNNTLNDNASIIKELNSKQNELYERLLKEKDNTIEQLKKEVEFLRSCVKK
jgi:transcriptional regulator with XRE-family HTH domain